MKLIETAERNNNWVNTSRELYLERNLLIKTCACVITFRTSTCLLAPCAFPLQR